MVGYEEPENGVNAARLELIARILRNAVEIRPEGLQFLLTTHSPYLCNLLPSSLILSTWTPESETQFKTFEGKPDSLFFTNEIVEALDSTTSETIIRARA
jgi:predicted ATPase